ncbi:hypothetical protein AArcSl_0209 [Halalkaliarchaeum desulfuricum]|uniref:Metal-dependent hydrolase n=1 Tax=Halalkaliarchaeum desulfuricum TaxID=2055893 RepID=A0A343TFJ2_9EURY|nr:metal-dependent hydrolase [Halalkaliarchaeum desulfuricum]AUX07864.1 hypothetical protein AArcSl_0209 [Halalkaliarchaeum desulfuricum]
MAPTHVAVGASLALPLLAVAPELAVVGALAGIAGGVFPDLDLFTGKHRKTLHFPVLYWIVAVPASGIAAFFPSPATVAVAVFFLSAAVHSVLDWFGAGDELKPWEGTSREGVYVHVIGRWLEPKRWIRYDGSPEDLALSAGVAAPGLLLYGTPIRELLVGALFVGVVYAVIRRRVPRYVGPYLE